MIILEMTKDIQTPYMQSTPTKTFPAGSRFFTPIIYLAEPGHSYRTKSNRVSNRLVNHDAHTLPYRARAREGVDNSGAVKGSGHRSRRGCAEQRK